MKLLAGMPCHAGRHHDGPDAYLTFAGPDAVEVGGRSVRVGGDYAACLVVTGYPAEVGPGWLEPLLSNPGRLDVVLHIESRSPAVADRLDNRGEPLHRHVTVAVRDQRGPGHTMHRVTEAVRALAACEVTATVVDGPDGGDDR